MQAVITIAGYGTRFLPASKAVPKEIFPIGGVPLIQHHVEALVASGITDIIVVARDGSDIVRNHFAPAPDLEQHLKKTGKTDLLKQVQRLSTMARITFARQTDDFPYGNATPALVARPLLNPDEPFYYMFGDDIIISATPVPRQLLDTFERFRPAAVLATQSVPDKETHLYGCVELKPNSSNVLARIVEKPAPGTAPSNQVQVGHFIFTPQLFEVLQGAESERGKGGELWMTDAVDRLAKRSTVMVQPIEGLWMAAGDPLRHLKANIEMSLRDPTMRDELIAYLRARLEQDG